jgi:predicted GIY-YIG superfamily endonuclease
MWYVYILFCDQKTYYVGTTNNLENRVKQHKNKESFYTKQFFDIQLVYSEKQPSKREAEKRELQIKKWSIAKKRALIYNDLKLLKQLSKGSGFADCLL